jgi:hypothetical protein
MYRCGTSFKGPFVSCIVLVLRLESSESYKMFNYLISQLPDVSSPSWYNSTLSLSSSCPLVVTIGLFSSLQLQLVDGTRVQNF